MKHPAYKSPQVLAKTLALPQSSLLPTVLLTAAALVSLYLLIIY